MLTRASTKLKSVSFRKVALRFLNVHEFQVREIEGFAFFQYNEFIAFRAPS